jgi:arylsulfatase A-like enzyme
MIAPGLGYNSSLMALCARRALLAALLLVCAACGRFCTPRTARLDLLAEFRQADVRSDSIDLPALSADPFFEKRGFSAPEGNGAGRLVWMLGGTSRLRLPFHSASDKELTLRARTHPDLGPSLELSVALNDVPLGSLTLSPAEQAFRLLLPASAQVRGDNLLSFVSSRRREPRPGDADRRLLVAAVSALEVRPLGSTARPEVPSLPDGRLRLPQGSSVGYYLRVPAAARLTGEIAAGTGPGQAELLVEDDAGGRPPRRIAAAPAGGSFAASLADQAGIMLRVELANDGARALSLSRLGLESQAPSAVGDAALPDTPARPNIVVYLVDTLRADQLGAYGQAAPTSPCFDAFAREAVLFEDAWAQASWTRAATASIFTGLHVGAHGVDREDRALPASATTLAERLEQSGYATGAFVGNHLLNQRFGFDQGFQVWNGGDASLYGAPAATLGERALGWLRTAKPPFFLYVHTMEPHSPYTPSAEDEAPFAMPAYKGDTDTRALLRLGQLGQLSPEGLQFLEARYRGEVHQNDRAFGALIDTLRSQGLLESTLVVFLADHGEELLDHGGTEHAKTLYQELVHIPLAVRLPGPARAGRREPAPVQQIDLVPTLLDFAGVPRPPGLPGRDLAALWLGRREAEVIPPLLFSEERFAVVDKYAVRAGATKLILNNDGPELWRAGSHEELYDLARDPKERDNLVASRPISVAFLRQELERFRARQAAILAGGGSGASLSLTPEEQEELRALGYLK